VRTTVDAVKALVLLLITAAVAFAAENSTQELLTDAQRNYLRGDLEAAKSGFQRVLEIEPRNHSALRYLRMIQAQEAKSGGGGQLEKELRSVSIARVDFRQASLDSALQYLKQEAARQGKEGISFVVQPDVDQLQKITLNLSNVPLLEVLRYIGDLANVRFDVQQYAIVVSKRGPESPSPAETPST
jgi:hypothetical protein